MSRWNSIKFIQSNSGIQNSWWLNNKTARISKPMTGSCNSWKRALTWSTNSAKITWERCHLLREISSLCRPKTGTLCPIWMTPFSLKIGANKKWLKNSSREIKSKDTHNSCSKVCRLIQTRKWATSTNSTNNLNTKWNGWTDSESNLYSIKLFFLHNTWVNPQWLRHNAGIQYIWSKHWSRIIMFYFSI